MIRSVFRAAALCAALLWLAAGPVFGSSIHGSHGARLGEYQLRVVTEPAMVEPGIQVLLTLTLLDPHGTPVKDLEIVHEKLVHLIVVREGLDVFSHLHPDLVGGTFSTTAVFAAAGMYYLYADFKPRGGSPVTAMAEVRVQGSPAAASALEVHVPGRIMTKVLGADVSLEKVTGGHRIGFTVLAPDEAPVTDLEPYLGAMGHLVVISADGKQYVHAHPQAGGEPGKMTFEARFPGAGLYKAWAEFKRGGQVHVLPFALRIE